MKTTDLFTTSSKKLNESLHKTFGKKINLETFSLDQLQDARNKLRTQLSQVRSESGFNENLENDAFHQAQWMLDAINAEIAERDEHIIESDVEEGFSNEVDMELHRIAKSEDEEMLIDALGGLLGTRVADALEDMKEELADELASKGMNDVMRDEDKMVELLMDKIVDEYGDGDFDDDDGQPSSYDEYQDLHGGDDWDHGQYDADESINNEELDGKYKDVDKDTGDRVIEWLEDWEGYLNDSDDFGLAGDVNELSEKFYQGEIGFKAVEKFVLDIAENPDSPLRQDWEENFPPNKVKITQPDMFDDMQTEGQYKDVDDKTGKKVVQWLEYHSDGVFDDDPHLGDALIRLSDKWETGDMSFRELKDAVLGMFEQGEWQRADFIQKFAPNKVKITQPDMFDDVQMEKAPPGAKAERMVKHIKKGYAKDGKLTDKERSIAYATAWKHHNKKKDESVEQGEDMTTLREGEVQQASAIVTAKTMVDRVGRWIEELSGMENETLLQLGDSIRDEMGQEQAKAFIEQCAPAIQQALETLKGTRDTLSGSVRSLASGEQPADMLGGEPAMGGEEEMGMPAPDEMNMPAEEPAGDEFGAAEPAAGGMEAPGREQRESIERQNRLLKVLAG